MAVIPGREAAKHIISGLEEDQVQPAGVDLRLGDLYYYTGVGVLARSGKQLPPTVRIPVGSDGFYTLERGEYKVRFQDAVSIPRDAVGLCFPRSSLLRMGVQLSCAVWDPGYTGRGEALLVVHARRVRIERGARIAQIVFLRLEEPVEPYSGSYQYENLPVADKAEG